MNLDAGNRILLVVFL